MFDDRAGQQHGRDGRHQNNLVQRHPHGGWITAN
jgi:hypothetical protein